MRALSILLSLVTLTASCGIASGRDRSLATYGTPASTTAPIASVPVTDTPATEAPTTEGSASDSTMATDSQPHTEFASTSAVLAGEPLARSSWHEGCPVPSSELSYLTVSYWDFAGQVQTGELIVSAPVASEVTQVFGALFDAEYPMSEMRITTQADIDDPDPLSNNSGSFACRPVTGSTVFSQHAYGLAIDINPFYNPYIKGGTVIPTGGSEFVDRSLPHPALIGPDSVVVAAFAEIGWSWGGGWNSLKDYQHFSLHNR